MPNCTASVRSPRQIGYASTMPMMPDPERLGQHHHEIRHRGMPRASRMANSLALAAVAE